MLRLTSRCVRIGALLLAVGAAVFGSPDPARAGSCCGGSAGPSLIVPKLFRARADLAFEWERYDGFWNRDGETVPDPPGSDLNQYRLIASYAHRLGESWQLYASVPYVWNDNRYSGASSSTRGVGDSTVGAWWEAAAGWLFLGPALTVPTGVSPYDDVDSSFDVTGRGFYRLDANALLERTVAAWDLTLSLGYGWHFERDVNREYGRYVEPYRRKLGNRFSAVGSIAYTVITRIGRWTGTGGLSYLKEEEGTIDGDRDPTSGFRKTAATAGIAYTTPGRVWAVRVGWNHAIDRDDWGENFPTTDIYTLGVSYAIR